MNEFKVIRNAHIYAPEDAGIQDVLICNHMIMKKLMQAESI